MDGTTIPLKSNGYVKQLPPGLRRALAAGRWLPIVGAGISAAAMTEDGRSPPTWPQLAEQLEKDLPGRIYAGPIDSISAYADTYGRSYLIERLVELLYVNEIQPGETHKAFAKLPFDTVVTTNFDFLVEQGYAEERRPCVPLIGESQLAIQHRPEATYLLKLHGDLNHPDQLVATEDDYDGFVRRNPLLATYLSWVLLGHEPVFMGYSLDDADMREVLTLLRERLGRMTRPAWAILPTDPYEEAPKFTRRGIKAIVLDKNPKADRSAVMASFFGELRTIWEHEISAQLKGRSDATTAELRRRPVAPQLALFIASRSLLALYRDFIFPVVSRTGLLALGIDDVQARDRSMTPMAIDMALSKAAVIIYDMGPGNFLPLDYVITKRSGAPLVMVSGPDDPGLAAVLVSDTTARPLEMREWPSAFVPVLLERISEEKPDLAPSSLSSGLHQLAGKGYEDQLLWACLALLESEVRDKEGSSMSGGPIEHAASGGPVDRLREYLGADFDPMMKAIRLRHDMMQDLRVNPRELKAAADKLLEVVQRRHNLPHA
ncbi:SIR2 family NAD-dependent protein deacylase [Streptomyces sp. NBC_01546]|uniref:SIR2 family NAD-dependent protein deacylase n=1 Tax=Streptomyces sp. NBC_01546 TaxID=2975872 RepID=UPI00386FA612